MYIKSAEITNIRSIENFRIDFENPAGWHVLIGDNGSGKSTIIKSLALALVRSDEVFGLRGDWKEWLQKGKDIGTVWLLLKGLKQDLHSEKEKANFNTKDVFTNNANIKFRRVNPADSTSKVLLTLDTNLPVRYKPDIDFFSVAYGPYRRFSGGNQEWNEVFANQPKLAAHLSAFGEDVALTEPVDWLLKLNYEENERIISEFQKLKVDDQIKSKIEEYADGNVDQRLGTYALILALLKLEEDYPKLNAADLISKTFLNEETIDKLNVFNLSITQSIRKLVNSPDFLPNNTKFESISSEGVFFKDGNGNQITINQLSDGYRSILSLTLELIRQLIKNYGEEAVFKNIRENDPNKMYIDMPGVVLIDEIDAHLHPTWQTKIGQWFLKYFPNIQFIVTTHSPLVCRAAEKGTIWRLAAPGSEHKSEQIIGVDRNRLIYGNVLDAYGTEVFGATGNTDAVHKKEELVRLSKKMMAGKTLPEEEHKLQELRNIFSTDAAIEL